MATTQIADIVEPRTFTPYMQENRPEKLVMLERSGILSPADGEVQSRFSAGGRKIEVPYWDDLDRTEPTIINDSDDQLAMSKITADDMTAAKHRMAKGWAAKSVAGMVATGNPKAPMEQVASRVNAYWAWVKEMRIMNLAKGVIADSVANHDGDMVFPVYQDIAAPVAANRISSQAVNRARLTLGDAMSELRAIGMHTHVYANLLDDEKIEFVKPSDLPFEVPTYMEMLVLHSEMFPVTAGANSDKYTCFLYGAGAFKHIDEVPTEPTMYGNMGTEITRDPKTGNGGGEDELITRRYELLHPSGMSWTSTNMADPNGATFSELANAANWERKYRRKNIRIAALDVNV
ncbi:hypothetical protein [Roseibium algae]|uniref:Coat protein n=1 Tax=Roseibium algae TaxID=3123038 RepID=A0ABU8TL83_9HYPH